MESRRSVSTGAVSDCLLLVDEGNGRISDFHLTDSFRLFSCLFPSGEEPVHDGIEPFAVIRFQQMCQLVYHNMFDTPVRQQEQIYAECQFMCAGLTASPGLSQAGGAQRGRRLDMLSDL